MEKVIIFIIGVVVGYIIEKALDWFSARASQSLNRRLWKRAERIWTKYQSLSHGLEVICTGSKEGCFVEQEVVITVDNTYKLPRTILLNIYKNHKAEWEYSGMKNNLQFGIYEIDPHRISDDVLPIKPSHELRIKGHIYHYFDFLATNRLLRYGTPEEQDILKPMVVNPHYLEPIPHFPNPLSVGLSLFCENGNCLVLARRTNKASSGGLIWGNTIYNSVGENAKAEDSYGINYEGTQRISPWLTAQRGLYEEMGLRFNAHNMQQILHSLVWDSRLYDYKFFGYIINDISRADVRKAWIVAPDRHENREIFFCDCGTENQSIKIIKEMIENREEWASESIVCTCLSLLHTKKIKPDVFEDLILKSKVLSSSPIPS